MASHSQSIVAYCKFILSQEKKSYKGIRYAIDSLRETKEDSIDAWQNEF